jgi:hypothetical protein
VNDSDPFLLDLEEEAAGKRPAGAVAAASAAPASERFYVGRILRLSKTAESGVLRTASGRELPIVAPHVEVLSAAGERIRIEDLREGMSVHFDVAWLRRGLIVSHLRVVAAPSE